MFRATPWLCSLALLLLPALTSAAPIRLHPDNPHYFLWKRKPAVLITSGEHYGAVLNRAFDYRRYLATLAADRLNLTRVFAGSYREVPGNFGIASNTLAPAPGDYLSPWKEVSGGKFDLTQWNPAFFQRLKRFVAEAARRGVSVELVLFCPFYEENMWAVNPMNAANNVNGIGAGVKRDQVLSLSDARLTEVQVSLVRKIVQELRGADTLYYEICNEPYFQGVTLEWQERIAQTIAETEAGFAKKHLIAQHWANGSKTVDRPNAHVGLYNFHYSRPPESVAMNRHLRRAIGNNETGFDGNADATYRIQGWEFLLAGGALYNNLDYSFTVGHEDGTFTPPASTPGGGSSTLRRQLSYLRAFFAAIPFAQMEPVTTVTVSTGAVRALAKPDGSVAALYLHHGRIVKDAKPRYQVDAASAARTLTLRNLPAGRYAVIWRNPHTGAELRGAEFSATGAETQVNTPEYSEDIAAVITRVK
ncbi:MAG: hypothetical protein IT162_19465 [Bryobacterales bacterium]|nr:hypothetical protein [Bryobacterales bacterium]